MTKIFRSQRLRSRWGPMWRTNCGVLPLRSTGKLPIMRNRVD